MFLSAIYVLCCVAHAPIVLSQLVYNMDSCTNVTFYRRSEMDDLVFARSLIEEINQVDKRAECFSQCQWQGLCNLVLYNPLTRTCRLYTDVFASDNEGLSRIGWQYYGVSCDGYRLANARPGVDIINAAVEDVCQDPFNVVTGNESSSCLRDGSWESVKIKCTSCYHGQVMLSLLPTVDHTEHLPFDLGDGMTFRMTASGDISEYNEVQFEMTNSDLPLLLSLRWTWGDTTRLVFNTRQGMSFGQEDVLDNITVHNINNYMIEIQIMETSFKTFGDGTLWMENQMRLPVTEVRRVTMRGFTAIHSLQVC